MTPADGLQLAPFVESFLPQVGDAVLENFILDLGIRAVPASPSGRSDFARLFFRKQALAVRPRPDDPEDLGFQANGDLRYQLTLHADGRVILEKAYERRWLTLVNADGKSVNTAKDFNLPLAEGTCVWVPETDIALRLTVWRDSFSVQIDGREVLQVRDPQPYPSGYCTLIAGADGLTCGAIQVTPLRDDLSLKDVEPTPLLARGAPLQHQVRLKWDNRLSQPIPVYLRVTHSTGIDTVVIVGEINPGEDMREVFIPDVTAEGILRVEVWAEGDARPLSVFEKNWKPQRKWTLFVVVSAHEDLGYCDWLTRLPQSMAGYLDMTRRIGEAIRSPEGERFHRYMIEHIWWLKAYQANRSESEFRTLIEEWIKPGAFEVIGVHSGTHTHWNDYEQLVRSTYEARRELPDRWGIEPRTAFYADTPGIAWAVVAPFAQAGIQYLLHCKGPWRTERNQEVVPDLFYWLAPNGKDRLLYQHRWCYTDALHGALAGGYASLRNRIGGYLSEREACPYDALCVTSYQDHELPNISVPETVRRWRSRWAFPDIRMSTPADYFQHMETQYADRIPTRTGDINDAWGDYAAIDPPAMSQKRQAAACLSMIEPLAAVSRHLDPSYAYPRAEIAEMCHRMMEFDEHCWATMLPPTLMNILNNDIVKKGNAALADASSRKLMAAALHTLAARLARSQDETILVWNPRPHEVSDRVRVDLGGVNLNRPALVDCATGKRHALQAVDDRGSHLAFLDDLPACGYRSYAVVEDGAPADSDWASVTAEELVTPHYRVGFDRTRGGIRSLYDLPLKVELLDPQSPYRFNQFLFVTAPEMCSPDIQVHTPEVTGFEVTVGPVAAVIRISFQENQSGARGVHEMFFYRDSRTIDVVNRYSDLEALLYKGSIGKSYGDIGNRYLGNVFYAFPFAVPDFRMSAEMAGGVLDLNDNRLMGVQDYVMANHWVDAGNARHGVALFTRDAPTIHCGGILYNRFLGRHVPEKSHFFVYAASNRMAGLSTRTLADCAAEFHFSVLPHAGGWADGGVPQWSWGRSLALQSCRVQGRSAKGLPPTAACLVEVSAPHVEMTVLKHAERPGGGLIVRLVETQGHAGTFRLTWRSGRLAAAWRTSLVEEDQAEIPVADGTSCELTIGAFDYLTVRLRIEDTPPGDWNNRGEDAARVEARTDAPCGTLATVRHLRVITWDSRRIILWWPSVDRATHYEVHRQEQPGVQPGPQTLVTRMPGAASAIQYFVDETVEAVRCYHYVVSAADETGHRGEPSPEGSAATPEDAL